MSTVALAMIFSPVSLGSLSPDP